MCRNRSHHPAPSVEAADKNVREAARRALAVLRSPSPTDTLKNNNPANPLVS